MKRRHLLTAVGTATLASVAGCNALGNEEEQEEANDPDESEGNEEMEAHLEAAANHLETLYAGFEDTTVLQGGHLTYNSDNFEQYEPQEQIQEFDAAQTELSEAGDLLGDDEDAPDELERLRGLAIIAETQIVVYGRLIDLNIEGEIFTEFVEQEEYGEAAARLESEAGEYVAEISRNGDVALQTVETFEQEGFEAGQIVDLDQITDINSAATEFDDVVLPGMEALGRWSQGIQNGLTGRLLIDEGDLAGAKRAYIGAVQELNTAQDRFEATSPPTPIFDETVARFDCTHQLAIDAYELTLDAIEASENGEDDRADELVADANEKLGEYRAECDI